MNQTCKWCRESIIPTYPTLQPGWRHEGGDHFCAYHPETLAEPADNKWEDVYASIESFMLRGVKLYKIQIIVVFEGRIFDASEIISAFEVEQAYFDLFSHHLNRMVQELDQKLWVAWTGQDKVNAIIDNAYDKVNERLRTGMATVSDIDKLLRMRH